MAGTSVSSRAALIVPNRVVAVRAVLKLSLRSATSPLALNTPSACDTTCIGALTRLLCTLWCCNVFVLARHLMHAQHRHGRWDGCRFTISSRESAKCAQICSRERRWDRCSDHGAPSCCRMVQRVYFGSWLFSHWVGLVVWHWGLRGTHPCVIGGQHYGYYSRVI